MEKGRAASGIPVGAVFFRFYVSGCQKRKGGKIEYDVPVMKVQVYTLDDLFEKRLLFRIPFYIFSHEKNSSEYHSGKTRLSGLRVRTILAQAIGLAYSGSQKNGKKAH